MAAKKRAAKKATARPQPPPAPLPSDDDRSHDVLAFLTSPRPSAKPSWDERLGVEYNAAREELRTSWRRIDAFAKTYDLALVRSVAEILRACDLALASKDHSILEKQFHDQAGVLLFAVTRKQRPRTGAFKDAALHLRTMVIAALADQRKQGVDVITAARDARDGRPAESISSWLATTLGGHPEIKRELFPRLAELTPTAVRAKLAQAITKVLRGARGGISNELLSEQIVMACATACGCTKSKRFFDAPLRAEERAAARSADKQ